MPQLDLVVRELGVSSLAREAKTIQIQTDDGVPACVETHWEDGFCTLQSGLGRRRKKRLPLFLNRGQQAAQRTEGLSEVREETRLGSTDFSGPVERNSIQV